MAYDGGYGRQYGGAPPPQQQRMPPPRDPYQSGPRQQQYNAQPPPPPAQHHHQQQPYDDGYQNDYGFDNGYGQEYDAPYQDQGYEAGPPHNQAYPPRNQFASAPPGPGRGMGPPMSRGRGGGPIPRPPTTDSARSAPVPPRGGPLGPPGPPRGHPQFGRGDRPVQYDRAPNSDPSANRHRMEGGGPTSPTYGGGYGNAYPGQPRRPEYNDDEMHLNDRMANMDIGNGPSRGYQQGGFGAEYRNDGYGAQQPTAPQGRDEFGPPSRSRTMPLNDDPMAQRGPPQRMGTMPMKAPPGRDVPARPATSQSHRPPPQRMYGAMPSAPPRNYDADSGYGHDAGGGEGVADVIDDYYAPSRMSNPEFSGQGYPHQYQDNNFDGYNAPRGSFDQQPYQPYNQPPPPQQHREPDMTRTKSQPDLRQPHTRSFEAAADAPPMPPIDVARHGSLQGTRAPPPMGRSGLPANPMPSRNSNPDALPSHPTPVRPGHMAGSVVSINDRPTPVRNYQGGTGGPSPQGQQQQQQQQQQARPAPQPAKPITPVTPEELEHLRVVIKNNPNDQESALRLSKRLIEAADVLVPNVADPRARHRARERYLMDAHKILKKLSSAQNVEAMFINADAQGRGLFSNEPDNKEAFTLYQSAAKLGHASAAYRTAVCCEIGHEDGGGTRKDPLKAIQWYKRAATLGDTPAMYKMGMILLKGLLGQTKNPREAVSWLKRAAERADSENPHALHELGLLYESAQPNDAIIRDEAYAFTLFRQAADLGYKFSQFRLGCAYEFGLMGCPVDPRQSILWYSKAATQEEHQAELALSGWYLTGSEGVLQQSDTEAYLWARKAAIAGLAKAEYAMGYFTEVGIGAPSNMEDAKRWYWRAAAQDFPKARERLEDLKRAGKNSGPRQRERVSRTKNGKQQEVFK